MCKWLGQIAIIFFELIEHVALVELGFAGGVKTSTAATEEPSTITGGVPMIGSTVRRADHLDFLEAYLLCKAYHPSIATAASCSVGIASIIARCSPGPSLLPDRVTILCFVHFDENYLVLISDSTLKRPNYCADCPGFVPNLR